MSTLNILLSTLDKTVDRAQHFCLTKYPLPYGKRIIIHRSLLSDEPLLQTVLRHELEHIEQRHYRDTLLMVWLQLLQWWNPFAWGLMQRHRNTLEYLADEGVLKSGCSKKEYQLQLLRVASRQESLSLDYPVLSFSLQHLKGRIMQMNSQQKKRKWLTPLSIATLLLIAPLLLIGTQMVHAQFGFASDLWHTSYFILPMMEPSNRLALPNCVPPIATTMKSNTEEILI